jgi:hypothetical protein
METQQVTTRVVERPGPYFAGPLAALVTAGGRLLLGLAETLALERGIGHVLTDTDSIVLVRPGGMAREVFQQHVRDVADWFLPLSPFEAGVPLLKIEDYNYAVAPDGKVDRTVLEPLWVIPVSSKRYVAYNRLPDGSRRIRKFSSCGVGTWQGREGYRSPAHIPEPWCDVGKLAGGTGSSSAVPSRSAGGPTSADTPLLWSIRRPRRPPPRQRGWRGGKGRTAGERPLLSWPVALRQVQGWLDPWTMLWRYWRAWSSAPPPPAVQALLDAVASGRPLHLPLRI